MDDAVVVLIWIYADEVALFSTPPRVCVGDREADGLRAVSLFRTHSARNASRTTFAARSYIRELEIIRSIPLSFRSFRSPGCVRRHPWSSFRPIGRVEFKTRPHGLCAEKRILPVLVGLVESF